jgi:hypothetical protein
MLDERALRRADFAGGVPVALCDGQEWTFPEPRVEFLYDPGPEGYKPSVSFGEAFEAKLQAYRAAESGPDVIRTELAIAWDLLTRNYDLTPEQFGELVRLRLDDPVNRLMREAILDVAYGNSPKASPAGSA